MLALRTFLMAVPLVALAALVGTTRADGPKDNIPDSVRPIPPKGIEVPKEQQEALEKAIDQFRTQWEITKLLLKDKPDLLDLAPDVEIFLRAVEQAAHHKEFHAPREVPAALNLLKIGQQRMKELAEGKPSWLTATGPVVRGYRSKIDDTVQPYAIMVPKTFATDAKTKRRLDFWWHGRGETLSEVNFITSNSAKDTSQFPLEDGFVLHPYGRYSNANKFAGEVDSFEALEHAKKYYPIDTNRLLARGFSMGGAACWQFATHFPTFWCAANPGAGFAETPEFLQIFQSEKVEPTWYEKKLWHMYNATDYAQNIFNLPTVAYSGEIDKQKQAADVMAREMKKVGLELTHIIGPKTAHKYEAEAKKDVAKRIDAIAAKGKDPMPKEIKFTTYTTRYNTCGWLTVDGLDKHWEPASVEGTFDDGAVTLKTKNVSRLTLWIPPVKEKRSPIKLISVDGAVLALAMAANPRATPPEFKTAALHFPLEKRDGRWQSVAEFGKDLVKKPGLQGPIDDAFMSRFIMVQPTGKSSNEQVEKFVQGEMRHAVAQWRQQFRGDAIVKKDTEITDDDIKDANLILWGDPSSNAVLKKIVDRLPIKWGTHTNVEVGDKKYDPRTHVPVMIYPNPLNPKKYIVLNSGFTYREYAYLNNARQVPMLPDYAIVDITTPPNSVHPGKIVQAGFFGEKWELLPNDGQ